jgi:hypothetical protein
MDRQDTRDARVREILGMKSLPVFADPAPRRPWRPGGSLLLFWLALAVLPACRACGDHPFVPYRIDATEGERMDAQRDAARDAAREDSGAAVERTPALIAPPHATSWAVGPLTLQAPTGSALRQALSWDVDGDGFLDALALVDAGDPPTGESLYFYRGAKDNAVLGPTPVPLVSGGAPLTLDPRCKRVESLARVGRRSAAVEIGETCGKEVGLKGADRSVALVSWSGSLRTRVGFDVVDAPDAPTLAFDLDGTDVDGDGLDDVTLRITLEGGGAPFEPLPSARALFRWFDRTAGLSREPGEPDKTLHSLAATAWQRAAHAKDAPSAIAMAAAGRALVQAVCSESPARRVAPPPAAEPLVCDAGHALEELGLASTHAYATLGDALSALAALDDAELSPATKTPARVAETEGWIASVAPSAQRIQLRAISAVPKVGPASASWGALRFDTSGNVLVMTPAGVVRVDPMHGDETDAVGVRPWSTAVLSPKDGEARLKDVSVDCDRSALEATFGLAESTDEARVLLPISSPIAARCGGGFRLPVSVIPIAWAAGGLELIAQGVPVLISPDRTQATRLVQLLNQPETAGAPLSPLGKVLVVPTSRGILVRGDKSRLLRAAELEHGYTDLRDCTVSDDASRVACVRGGAAFVGVWPPP